MVVVKALLTCGNDHDGTCFNMFYSSYDTILAEVTAKGVLQKQLLLKISQYSQKNSCVGVSF